MHRRPGPAVIALAIVATIVGGCGSSHSPNGTPADASRAARGAAVSAANATATAAFDATNRAGFGGTESPGPSATPYPPAVQDAAFVSRYEGWALRAGEANVWHTTDAGNRWGLLGAVDFTPQYIAFRDQAHGLITGVRQPGCFDACAPAAAATADGGRTWSAVALPAVAIGLWFDGTVARIHARECTGPCTRASSVRIVEYVSADDGSSWRPAAAPAIDQRLCADHTRLTGAVSWLDRQRGWAICAGQGTALQQAKQLYKTTDGGATWTLVAQHTFPALPTPPPGTPDLPGPGVTALVFQTANDGWLGTGEPGMTLQRTRDGGRTWTPVLGDTLVQRIEFTSSNDGYVVMRYGLWWTTDGGDHWQRISLP